MRRDHDRGDIAGPDGSQATTVYPSDPPSSASARPIGAVPWTATTGAGMTGSRKISSVPPDRHGFTTVSLPDCCGSSTGEIRSNSESPESSNARPCARTVDSAHVPPTKPSIVPSASTIASSPGLADVGRSASTTRACTNGTRSRCSASARLRRSSRTLTGAHPLTGRPPVHPLTMRRCRSAPAVPGWPAIPGPG